MLLILRPRILLRKLLLRFSLDFFNLLMLTVILVLFPTSLIFWWGLIGPPFIRRWNRLMPRIVISFPVHVLIVFGMRISSISCSARSLLVKLLIFVLSLMMLATFATTPIFLILFYRLQRVIDIVIAWFLLELWNWTSFRRSVALIYVAWWLTWSLSFILLIAILVVVSLFLLLLLFEMFLDLFLLIRINWIPSPWILRKWWVFLMLLQLLLFLLRHSNL